MIHQVVFSYSGNESWKLKINHLEEWKNETEKILQKGVEFYNREISSSTGDQLLNLTKSANDNVTITGFSTLEKIKARKKSNCDFHFPKIKVYLTKLFKIVIIFLNVILDLV